MTTITKNFVYDLNHGDNVTDFKISAAAGLRGIIHKASQGTSMKDPAYDRRRGMAKDAGLLWAAYHFNDGSDVKAQVSNFLSAAKPDSNTGMWLDFEDNTTNMSIQDAVIFMKRVEDSIGREAGIYSGNRLKENIGKLSSADFDYLTSRRLWLCQYGNNAILPKGYKEFWLWQFSGDGFGPLPHDFPGIATKNIDLNTFIISEERFVSEWAGKPLGIAKNTQVPVSNTIGLTTTPTGISNVVLNSGNVSANTTVNSNTIANTNINTITFKEIPTPSTPNKAPSLVETILNIIFGLFSNKH